jgi:hypothetical protein
MTNKHVSLLTFCDWAFARCILVCTYFPQLRWSVDGYAYKHFQSLSRKSSRNRVLPVCHANHHAQMFQNLTYNSSLNQLLPGCHANHRAQEVVIIPSTSCRIGTTKKTIKWQLTSAQSSCMIRVNHILINYPNLTNYNKYTDNGLSHASKKNLERGRHSFCLSFLAEGKSSCNRATYPQYRGYLGTP